MSTRYSLHRAIDVIVDRTSWRTQPPPFRHPFPRALGRQSGAYPVHLLEMLLRLGDLTTPGLNVQSGVAKLWPLLRYLHIVADTPGLRLRAAWADVDRHQKAVASDDLGVGLGMAVLYSAFDYRACVDGRAFLHRLSQLGLLASVGGVPPKVGVMKMADYAALDASGKVHLVECKGTQHSAAALASAMADGQLQKQSLVCSSPGAERRLIGQRLVVGTHLMLEGATRETRVVVMDPAPLAEEPVILAPRISGIAVKEAALRLEAARIVGSAGAARTASALAQSDLAADAVALPGTRQRERIRDAFGSDEPNLESFDSYGEAWVGERLVAPLLEPFPAADRVFRYARLTKGISRSLVDEMLEVTDPSPLFQDQYPGLAERLGSTETDLSDQHAAIVRHGLSMSSIELLEYRKR